MESFTTIYEKIRYALNDLPGESAHKEMFPRRRLASEEIKSVKNYRISAVLALLYEDNGTKIVLTQRNTYNGRHSGQISFPGGKQEKFDATIMQTAIRESQEEIGVDPSNINVLGKLTDVFIPVSKFLVHPFIAIHEGLPDFTPSEREVKEIIPLDLNALTDSSILQKRDIKMPDGMVLKNIPCFIVDNKVVWGATALMLNEIRQILLR